MSSSQSIVSGRGRGRLPTLHTQAARRNDDADNLNSEQETSTLSPLKEISLDPSPPSPAANEKQSSSDSDWDSDDDQVNLSERARLHRLLARFKLEREAHLKANSNGDPAIVTVGDDGDNITTESTDNNKSSLQQNSFKIDNQKSPSPINKKQDPAAAEASTNKLLQNSLNHKELQKSSTSTFKSYLISVKRNSKVNYKNNQRFDSVYQLDYYFDLADCIGKKFLLKNLDFKSETIHLLPSQECNIKKFRDCYFQLRDEINDHCLDGTVAVKDPYIGQVVCVSYSEEFVRACIQEINGAFAIIKLIDVGGEIKTLLKALFQINSVTMKFPIFGQEVKLAYIEKYSEDNIWPRDKEDFYDSYIDKVIIVKEIIEEGVVLEIPGSKKLFHEAINDLKTWTWEKLLRDQGYKNDAELVKACTSLSSLTSWKSSFMLFPASSFKLKTVYTAQLSNFKFDPKNGSVIVSLHNFEEYNAGNSSRKEQNPVDTFYSKTKRILEMQTRLYDNKVAVKDNYYPKNGDSFFAHIGVPQKMPDKSNVHFNSNPILVRGLRFDNHLMLVDYGLYFAATGDEANLSAAEIKYRIFCPEFYKIPALSVYCTIKNTEGFEKKGKLFNDQLKQFLTKTEKQKHRFEIVEIDKNDNITIELTGFKTRL